MKRTLPVLLISLAFTASSEAAEGPSYQRHVAAVFSRLGCNGGTCHGSVQGQNGFRLSLFGADPSADHARILREVGGRRLNRLDPDASLLLLKATGQIEHGGGQRLTPGSVEYNVLRRWIAAGAPADDAEPSRLAELRITPTEQVVKLGETYRLKVEAKFADGSVEDVTAFCSFTSLDVAAAEIDAAGQVTAKAVGEAALIVRYRAHPALVRVLIPATKERPFPNVKAHNFIDEHVLARLRQLNLPPAELADDATFLRRVSLDVTGALPTAEEVRTFLDDKSAEKRPKKIDELLTRPGHAALWTLRFCDLLKAADYGVYADALSVEQDAPRFQAWIRARLEENTPYDEFVARILTATSREGRSPEEYAKEVAAMMAGYAPGQKDLEVYRDRQTLDLYWQRRGADGVGGAMQVAHAFLGLRLECAQCHRHPHDVWQQSDLLDFANFFMRVRKVGFQGDNEKKYPEMAALKKKYEEEGKKLAEEVKKRKEGEGKRLDEAAKKAGADQATKDRAEAYRKETADLEKRAKVYPEVGRRLLQAEMLVLPPGGKCASVTSPLGTQESKTLRLLGDTQPTVIPAGEDPRKVVADWMRRPDNPYFAKAIVNRVWAHYFGRGIIDPPDNLSAFNPPTHPKLLHDLCAGFIAKKYDLRWLHRTILTSRTYQQASTPHPDAATDRANYAAFPLRRLPAEVLLDALNTATGTTENLDMKYHHWPDALTTVEVPYPPRNPFVAFVLETYGRPKRNAAVQCDCERDGGASVFQVLALANHPRVWEKLRDPTGRVAKLLKQPGDDAAKLETLFLATVSRPPTDAERDACRKYLLAAGPPEKGWQGVLWGLINTREFLLQH